MSERGGSEQRAGAAGHARCFKLRFAAQRVPGHSYVSALRPRALPALVTDKWWTRGRAGGEAEAGAGERALRTVQDMFARGPRDKYPRPLLTSHEYGWWREQPGAAAAARGDRRLQRPLRDSPWLKAQLRVLAADAAARKR